MKIEWSPLALDRVCEIASYIAQDKQVAAREWVDKLFDHVKRLSRFPRSGRMVPEIGRQEIRELILGNYRVVYKIERNRLIVLTVRHGKQILPIDEIRGK